MGPIGFGIVLFDGPPIGFGVVLFDGQGPIVGPLGERIKLEDIAREKKAPDQESNSGLPDTCRTP